MTRLQEVAVDRLALEHGRLMIRGGYADRALRVTAPSLAHWIVDEAGVPHRGHADASREAVRFMAEAD